MAQEIRDARRAVARCECGHMRQGHVGDTISGGWGHDGPCEAPECDCILFRLRRPGRPLTADAARSAPVQVRLSPAERATLRARCEGRGVTVSDALRELARGAGLLD